MMTTCCVVQRGDEAPRKAGTLETATRIAEALVYGAPRDSPTDVTILCKGALVWYRFVPSVGQRAGDR